MTEELWIIESPLLAVPDCVKHAKRFSFEGFAFESEAEANQWSDASGGEVPIYKLSKHETSSRILPDESEGENRE